MASVLSKRINNNAWLKIHYNHCFHINYDNIYSIIIGDLIAASLVRYNNLWKNLFSNRFINLGIHADRVGYVLWCVRDIAFPPRFKNVVILCGTNNINKDPPAHLHSTPSPPDDIVQGLIAIVSSFKDRLNNPNITIIWLMKQK